MKTAIAGKKIVEECTENIVKVVNVAEVDLFEHENKCVCPYAICLSWL